ncbi:PA0069 family radical SAM protein [bacterium]|nr:MAG: PA0069 family radical SAM protein [bacterium]
MPTKTANRNKSLSSSERKNGEFAEEYNEFESIPQKQFTTTTKGRSSGFNPVNRFDDFHLEKTADDITEEDIERKVRTEFIRDNTKTILSKNDSPDIPYTYSINPYRGCEHGCIYCYARPSHEYLGYSSGMDFETKILVKHDAAKLLEKTFLDPKWNPEPICLSGNTDCYQPAERNFKLTRDLLNVFLKFRNPLRIITKNFLITRDIDILKALAELHLAHVVISITTLDKELSRRMEPRTSIPSQRLEAIALLAGHNIPVGVLAAPIIPGLNDHELPEMLRHASDAGATTAGYTVIRLSHALKELFKDWIEREYPDKYEKIIHSIQDVRNGKLNNTEWGKRMQGEGEMAEYIAAMFKTFSKKYGLNNRPSESKPALFLRGNSDQINLFDQQ